ncbi:MAG: hypothetical protein IT429_12165, partial [Gemmataceae bacterium]|nr:hypothetical protein [Gemmataceae bacterium]
MRSLLPAVLGLVCGLSAGCTTFGSLCDEPPPVGPVCRAAVWLQSGINTTHDPANGGAALRGLAGRLYLFDSENPRPLAGDGSLIIDLYDDRPLTSGGQPKPLERWQYDKEVLTQLLRKDVVGWGYTLFMPWVNSYRPDINQIHVRICFVPRNGVPIYADSSTVTLMPADTQGVQVAKQVTGSGKLVDPTPAVPAQAAARTASSLPVMKAPVVSPSAQAQAVRPASATTGEKAPLVLPDGQKPVDIVPRRTNPTSAAAPTAVQTPIQRPASTPASTAPGSP